MKNLSIVNKCNKPVDKGRLNVLHRWKKSGICLLAGATLLTSCSAPAIPVLAADTGAKITIEKPTDWKQEDTVIEVTVDDSHLEDGVTITKLEARSNGGVWEDITDSHRITITGNTTVYVKATDSAGNIYQQNRSIKCYDSEKPTLTASLTDGVLNIKGSDTVSGIKSFTVNGTEYTNLKKGTLKIQLTQKDFTTKKIKIKATDKAGNVSNTYSLVNPYYEWAAKQAAKSGNSDASGSSGSSTKNSTGSLLGGSIASGSSSGGSSTSGSSTGTSSGGTSGSGNTTTGTSSGGNSTSGSSTGNTSTGNTSIGTSSTGTSASGSSSGSTTSDSSASTTSPLPQNATASDPTSATGTVKERTVTGIESQLAEQNESVDSISTSTTEGGKEFYTITTKSGKTFYLVIDNDKSQDNVYFLTEADDDDLMNFTLSDMVTLPDPGTVYATEEGTDDADISGQNDQEVTENAGTIAESETNASEATSANTAEETAKTKNPAKEKESKTGSYVLIGLIAAGIGAGAWYMKIYKPKHEFDDEDEYEDSEENSEPYENEDASSADSFGTQVLEDEEEDEKTGSNEEGGSAYE